MLRSLFWRLALVCAVLVTASGPGFTDEDWRRETYVTVDCAGRAAGVASSTVWSLFAPLDEPGLRLKMGALTSLYGDANTNVFSNSFIATGLTSLASAMAGYQLTWREIWIKVYAGAAYQAETQAFWRVGSISQQKNYGATAAIETYWQSDDGIWLSGNLSWQQFDNATSFFGRAAYKVFQDEDGLSLSVGAETAATIKNADRYLDGRRLGDFTEYVSEGALINLQYGAHDFSLSGGLAKASDDGGWQPYIMLSYGMKF